MQVQVPGMPAVEELHVVKVGLPSGGQVPQECVQASELQLFVPQVLGQVQTLTVLVVVFKVLLKQQFLLKIGGVSAEAMVSQPTS